MAWAAVPDDEVEATAQRLAAAPAKDPALARVLALTRPCAEIAARATISAHGLRRHHRRARELGFTDDEVTQLAR
ncbi:hypothetical protein [Pseudonocardia acidicola]|uniref:Uncharacterized protein n=1 Tax=Pseudonocardia acidicola TaxID=2724939 RepID=A0ABX1SHG8_9PSEU|nr:hypothetical protein [Pseudonocardia acidicola]NMH99918.1 hypothetical protein [Pseudonocardia acidicola]